MEHPPPDRQDAAYSDYHIFNVGVGVGSKDSSAAKALIKFLTTPAALQVIKAKGLEPAG